LRAGLRAFFREYQPTGGHITMNRRTRRVNRLFSLMVVKQPFFGMGLNAVPKARWDDGRLHATMVTPALPGLLVGLLTGFTVGNQVGDYFRGEKLIVALDEPRVIQLDGELGWSSNRFAFRVLPGVLRLKH
jgi:diacylglycerol kinase family enzyme